MKFRTQKWLENDIMSKISPESKCMGTYHQQQNIRAIFFLEKPSSWTVDFLNLELVPALTVMLFNKLDADFPTETIWLQQDGAPPYFDINEAEQSAGLDDMVQPRL